ncbi:MAG: AMP-binding protein [Fibrobacteria bacterium]|nr:AMP-binding protein [Fibrobacteria bacterium]
MDITPEQLVSYGLTNTEATSFASSLRSLPASSTPEQRWMSISKKLLKPRHPFQLHLFLFQTTYANRDPLNGPPPAWCPDSDSVTTNNIEQLMTGLKIDEYNMLHKWSVDNRGEFWTFIIETLGIRFSSQMNTIMGARDNTENPQWLSGTTMNIADSCFLAHGEQIAIIYQNEEGEKKEWTYNKLHKRSCQIAQSLVTDGFKKGDKLACFLPTTPESTALYLGIIMAGCVVVSIAESFSDLEIKKRMRISGAECLITQDTLLRGGKEIPLYEKAVSAEVFKIIVMRNRGSKTRVKLRGQDILWEDWLSPNTKYPSEQCLPEDPINVLFSSGTTGDPKAIPWTHTTPIKCAMDGFLHHNIQPGDVVSWPSSLGWMMGPWLIFAGLINRATIALYNGIPTGKGFVGFVQEAKVTILGVVPSLVKAWRTNDSVNGFDWEGIKAFSSTGECSNAEDMLYLMSQAGYKPVIEYCGGTEIGGGYLTGTVIQPSSPATFTTPALGLDLVILNDEGEESDQGEVFLIGPSIGLSTTLLNADHQKVYYNDTPLLKDGRVLRRHGDELERLPGGWYRAQGRADDTMNLGGIKVSSAEIERTLNTLEGINETAAIAIAEKGGGPTKLVVYVVEEGKNIQDKEQFLKSMNQLIRQKLNPLFKIEDVCLVNTLPRTTSNKIMRRKLRDRYSKFSST